MRTILFVICCLSLGFSPTVHYAEEIEPIRLHFDMVGAGHTLYNVEIESTPSVGVSVRAFPEFGSSTIVETFARSLEPPLLTYHSREVGQLAVISYWVGGGTGVSYARYFIIACMDDGSTVIHEGLAEFVAVEPRIPGKSFLIQSEFQAIRKGFSQIVRVERPAQIDRDRDGSDWHNVLGPVELNYYVDTGNDGLIVRCEINRDSAHALMDFLESGVGHAEDWAAGIIRKQWPDIIDRLKEYLDAPASIRRAKMGDLRAEIDEMFLDP